MNKELYQSILKTIELNNISLYKISSLVEHKLLSENMVVSIEEDASYSYENKIMNVTNQYSLFAKNKDNDVVFKIESTFLLNFSASVDIDDSFFDIYKQTSLPLNVWPYFRELVNNISSRMNIPPITLPLMKR